MSATKEAYYEAHVVNMLQLMEVSLKAYKWLKVIPKQKRCKHGLSFYYKCDALMNNHSESFNANILLQREKPIITMFEWMGNYLIGRFAMLREKVDVSKG